MELKELMLDDLVMVNGKVGKIKFLTDSNALVQIGEYDAVDTDSVEPISLTPEIIEKNSFEKVLDEDGTECYRYYNSAADGYIKITLYDGGDSDWSIEIINYDKFNDNEIVYKNDFIFLKVHQLQHILKLCGIDREIVL